MRLKKTGAAPLIALVTLLAILCTSCTAEPPDLDRTPTPSLAPTPAPSVSALPEAADAQLSAAQDRLRGHDTAQVTGDIESADGNLQFALEVSLEDQSFSGKVTSQSQQAGRLDLEIIRTSQTTWIKSTPEYWIATGYDEESASKTIGKYVVFTPEAGNAIADVYDFASVILSFTSLESANVVTLQEDGYTVFEVSRPEVTQRYYVDNATGELLRIVSGGKFPAEITIQAYDFPLSVEVPPADQVVQ